MTVDQDFQMPKTNTKDIGEPMVDSPTPKGDGTPEEWTLDDVFRARKGEKRLRFTSKDIKRGDTEPVNFRADCRAVRRVQVIVESGIDPELETKSDIMNDALHLWLTKWDEDHPDGAQGKLAYQFRMRELQRKMDYQDSFVSSSTNILEGLAKHGDIIGIKEFLVYVGEARFDFADAPLEFKRKIDDLMETARRLLKGSGD